MPLCASLVNQRTERRTKAPRASLWSKPVHSGPPSVLFRPVRQTMLNGLGGGVEKQTRGDLLRTALDAGNAMASQE